MLPKVRKGCVVFVLGSQREMERRLQGKVC